jgi:hypothetical protein
LDILGFDILGIDILVFDILGFDILGFDILEFGILGFGILEFGILGFDILGFDILEFGILEFGILEFGILGFDILGFGILGLIRCRGDGRLARTPFPAPQCPLIQEAQVGIRFLIAIFPGVTKIFGSHHLVCGDPFPLLVHYAEHENRVGCRRIQFDGLLETFQGSREITRTILPDSFLIQGPVILALRYDAGRGYLGNIG